MDRFEHILLPTDFGDAATAATDVAVAMAKAFGSRLTLLHTWELPVYPYLEPVVRIDPFFDTVQDAATRRLAEALASLQTRLPEARSILNLGIPWQEILGATTQLGVDLIVMGTHGHKGLPHLMLGSVAEKVVRLAAVPVMVVHPHRG